jgi:polyisoprenoid-binding protein YceI
MKTKMIAGSLVASVLLAACGGAAVPAAPATEAAKVVEAVVATVAPAATAVAEVIQATATTAPVATEAPAAATVAPTEPPPAATEAPAAPAATGAKVYKIAGDQSEASYSVGEVFISQNNKFVTAIGITQKIEGLITLDVANPSKTTVGEITIDISALTSDSGRRDNAIRGRWLESEKFPMAKFKPTKIEGLPETYTAGQELTFKMTGDMIVRETTVPVTWDVKAKLDGDKLVGEASTAIKMSAFGFEAPNVANILKAEDDAKLAFKFVALPTQ